MFSDYLMTSKFIVYTDNNPLTYVLSSAKLDAITQRWIAALSSYNFEIKYRPGVNNADADALSRLPALANITDNTSELPLASVQAICNYILLGSALYLSTQLSSPVLLLVLRAG
jgi:hypothetical protein